MPGKYSSVLHYTRGIDQTVIHFPEDQVVCAYCPFCKHKITNGRRRDVCVKTYEPLDNVLNRRGCDCPLIFEEKKHE